MDTKISYTFDHKHDNLTSQELVSFLGGKGANLNRMTTELALPVPQGFTIPCFHTFSWRSGGTNNPLKAALRNEIVGQITNLNHASGKFFGDATNPLLVSVRSGAPKSMPGMMETILNIGLNDETVQGLASQTNEKFAWDSYRRFIQMYATTVFGIDPKPFQDHIEAAKEFNGTGDLPIEMIKLLVERFKLIVSKKGYVIPDNVYEQIYAAVAAVFQSWDEPKAVSYRKIEGIDNSIGTGVNIQRMVFGNMNDKSGTGVAFTRNPSTGENVKFGDFLLNAQGEDVVDGSQVTMPLESMESIFPDQYEQLCDHMDKLENLFKDMCDIEFTIEDGKLFMLQTRVGKRNPKAAVAMAFDMFQEGLIDRDTAVERLQAIQNISSNDDVFNGVHIATGLGASPGKVVGKAVFTSEDAVNSDGDVILIRHETSPNDVEGMAKAKGILTAKGGLVSHAAVVARGWGKPCVVGCSAVITNGIDATINGKTINKGDTICIDGETGEVFV